MTIVKRHTIQLLPADETVQPAAAAADSAPQMNVKSTIRLAQMRADAIRLKRSVVV